MNKNREKIRRGAGRGLFTLIVAGLMGISTARAEVVTVEHWRMGDGLGLNDGADGPSTLVGVNGNSVPRYSNPYATVSTNVSSTGPSGNGFSMDFTGTGGIYYSAASGLVLPNNNFFAEVWVKPDTAAVGMTVFSFGGNNRGYRIDMQKPATDFVWSLSYGGVRKLNSTSVVVPGQWTHLAVVDHGDSASLYVNGEIAATYTAMNLKEDFNTGANQTADIGGYYTKVGLFDGKIDELRIVSFGEGEFSPDQFLAGSKLVLVGQR